MTARLVLVSATALTLALTGGGAGSSSSQHVRVSVKGLTIRIDRGGTRGTELGGAGAPFVYWLADGTRHQATRALGDAVRGSTTTYRFATDERDRTMSLAVSRTGS